MNLAFLKVMEPQISKVGMTNPKLKARETTVLDSLLTMPLRKYFSSFESTSINFKVLFADGSSFQNRMGDPDITLTYKTRKAQLHTLIKGELGLLEPYFDQEIDIEGDIELLLRIEDQNIESLASVNQRKSTSHPVLKLMNWVHELKFSNKSISQAIENARFHYNQGTEFFRFYLDPSMTYTCAFWDENTTTLEQAQRNKLDLVCKKLCLQEGDKLIDVGSGWGSLLFHAYEQYGAKGTNYSPTPDQNKAMQTEIDRRGLQNHIKIVEKDFRLVEERWLPNNKKFDKYASTGVYEHAGKDQLGDWIQSMTECLKDGGLGVLHFIAHDVQRETNLFIRKHVFPGGYLPGLTETVELMANNGLEVLDIQNLRPHYAKTLDCWASNFDRNWEEIRELDTSYFNEHFRRRWSAYLHLCAESFRGKHSSQRLYQITFSKGNAMNYPATRTHMELGRT